MKRTLRLYGWRLKNLACAATGHRAFGRCRPGYYDGDGRETWDDYQAGSQAAREFRVEFERRWGERRGRGWKHGRKP